MYLKVVLRNLRREKLYTVLNVAGFALGIGSCLIDRSRDPGDNLLLAMAEASNGANSGTWRRRVL